MANKCLMYGFNLLKLCNIWSPGHKTKPKDMLHMMEKLRMTTKYFWGVRVYLKGNSTAASLNDFE